MHVGIVKNFGKMKERNAPRGNEPEEKEIERKRKKRYVALYCIAVLLTACTSIDFPLINEVCSD